MRYLNLYSNVFITKGAKRILISDLQKNTSEILPLELFDLIETFKTQSIDELISNYDAESIKFINEYIEFLLQKEYAFITADTWDKNFIPLSLNYNDYTEISNIFIEMENIDMLQKLVFSVDNLGIKHMVLLCNQPLSINDYKEIENCYADSLLQTIEIYTPVPEFLNNNFLIELDNITARITNVIFYNCLSKTYPSTESLRININFCEEQIKLNFCGKVDLKYFNTNQSKILEAINHNSCLHKKIGIDINGNIKNCPAMMQSFGNINDITLEEALEQNGFKQYWNLTKNDIEVCRDCEFRNVCTDCRAYTEQSHLNLNGLDISKPLKCGYNPYTNEWQDWSKNPLKRTMINHYGILQSIS
ncbi:grasp-with-spasm system SPASM domain peptide maturase [Pedobacter aquatilis]|uniref:grasp-with-spasm system SPASM domain peptide maturase n=1 Tax=Pedobacter aquatilis TaxID=351343 RepID=UPI00292F1577|nr:grasp-with-spasm system SPASM domain peptide maturase [Pedobacter aquatilis]